jgi:hypothetical protein
MLKKIEDICKEEYDKGYKDCFFDGFCFFGLFLVIKIIFDFYWSN